MIPIVARYLQTACSGRWRSQRQSRCRSRPTFPGTRATPLRTARRSYRREARVYRREAILHFETGIRSPLDAALLDHTDVDFGGYQKVDEIPFDFERRRVSVVMETPDGTRLLVTKGAPEQLMSLTTRVEIGGRVQEWDGDRRHACDKLYEQLGGDGFRVLAVAYRSVEFRDAYSRADEHDFVLAGFVAFADPVLPDAAAATADLRGDGVAVKILTGDNDVSPRTSAIRWESLESVSSPVRRSSVWMMRPSATSPKRPTCSRVCHRRRRIASSWR